MLTPFPHQITGAQWLSSRQHGLLADEPRVGKCGSAIMALDDTLAETVCVVTTASGRAVWRKAFKTWSPFQRDRVRIVGWPEMTKAAVRHDLLKTRWDRVILDESHKAKNYENATTQSVYGTLDDGGARLLTSTALFARAKGVWCLTGTPLPHDPADIYPMMRALCPERLAADPERGWPDVTRYEDFRDRYCKWRPKKLSNWRTIIVIMGGKNEDELNARLAGFKLLRTQKDAGIGEPIFETMPLTVSEKMLRQIEGDTPREKVLTAAHKGDTKTLDMHLGPIRRITGEAKARAVVDAVHDEFAGGLDKIVLAYWHKDVGQILKEGLAAYGVTGVDGSTPDKARERNVEDFQSGKARVFLAQIEAAGEAIDLSSAAMLWFVEVVFSPRAMKQMSLRVTNFTQTRQCFVRVCVLENSIDEAIQDSLMRLWSTIREVLK